MDSSRSDNGIWFNRAIINISKGSQKGVPIYTELKLRVDGSDERRLDIVDNDYMDNIRQKMSDSEKKVVVIDGKNYTLTSTVHGAVGGNFSVRPLMPLLEKCNALASKKIECYFKQL